MRLMDIALNNLRRRQGKMLFLVSGLVIAVATVVSLVSITNTMHSDIQDKIDQFGANIVVVPKSDDLTLSYGGITIATAAFDTKELRTGDVGKIRTIENSANIATIAPKLVGAVDAGSEKALLVGVDFGSEFKLKKWWEVEGAKPNAPNQLLAGSSAAARLGLAPGKQISIGDRTMDVVGTLRPTGSADDSLLFAELSTVQAILDKPESLSLIEISALCKSCPIEDIVGQISQKLPDARVTALAQTVKSRQQTVDQLTSFSVAVSAVVLLISALIVLTTMMSSVNERTREIGIFRAVGFRKEHVMRIILSEALAISALGGAAGWLLGMVASLAISQQFVDAASLHWDPWLAVVALALAVFVGVAGSIYPAVQASNLDPAEALRFI